MSLFTMAFHSLLTLFIVFCAHLTSGEINSLSKATTKFGLDILKANGYSSGSVFFSPASISASLGMVYAGSAGQTKNQINKALYDGLIDHEIYEQMKDLSKILNNPSMNFELSIANRLYVQNKFELLKNYLSTLKTYFQSELKSVDFEKSAETVRKEINKWVENQTNQKIKDMFPENSLDGAVLVLVNAIYFKGTWSKKFDYTINSKKTFTTENEKFEVDMMKKYYEDYLYNENDDVKVLGLPYSGDQLAMYIILPKSSLGLAQVESKLTSESFQNLIQNARSRKISEIQIPKLKLEKELDLNRILKSLGMMDMFNPDNADLSGIGGKKDLVVSDALHKAFVEVNEDGTEAAGVSAAAVAEPISAIINPRPKVNFIADHPFLFTIVERNSWNPLFLGRFVGK